MKTAPRAVSGVIQRSEAKVNVWQQRMAARPALPAGPGPVVDLTDPLPGEEGTPEQEAKVKEQNAEHLKTKRESKQKELDERGQIVAELEKLKKRENWWPLLDLPPASSSNIVVQQGVFGGRRIHITIYKDKTSSPSVLTDPPATIVDKLFGKSNVKNSVHATLELYGPVNDQNPHYYRNGFTTCNDAAQRAALQQALEDFIEDMTERVTTIRNRIIARGVWD